MLLTSCSCSTFRRSDLCPVFVCIDTTYIKSINICVCTHICIYTYMYVYTFVYLFLVMYLEKELRIHSMSLNISTNSCIEYVDCVYICVYLVQRQIDR